MLFVLWLSLGLNFFTSAPSQPWLPPNPTDKCSMDTTTFENSTGLVNTSMFINSSFTQSDLSVRIDTYRKEMDNFKANPPQGLDKLYSVSFRWFGAIGVMMTVVVGAIVSYLTDHPSTDEVDVRYSLPLGDQLFPYLPKKARRYLDFGVDFGKRKRWLEQQDVETMRPTDLLGELSIELDEDNDSAMMSSQKLANAQPSDVTEIDSNSDRIPNKGEY
ncbi:uncharacterized protein LOC117342058 [Pecten maximus]|uniref:uncharacterized protein LOC117342058 n=1 Tax=Pecten maximus TaxID=6579 RepID=UPI0014590735|nr:uncharacterized protein LOC117342058 [Pecten maximus]